MRQSNHFGLSYRRGPAGCTVTVTCSTSGSTRIVYAALHADEDAAERDAVRWCERNRVTRFEPRRRPA